MVAKLIRHELRATARMMGFLYLAAVVITGAEMIGFYAGQPVVGVIFMLISYLHMMVLGVMTIVIVVRRFHSNLFGDQGYLTMCLPVKPSSLVFSKLLVALIWMILDVVFSLFSIFFMVSSAAGIEGLSVWQTMNQTFQEMGCMVAPFPHSGFQRADSAPFFHLPHLLFYRCRQYRKVPQA